MWNHQSCPTLITHQFSCSTCFGMKGTMSVSYTQSSPSNSPFKMINQLIYWPLLTFWHLIDILINNNKMCPCVAWNKACSTFVFKVTKAIQMLLEKGYFNYTIFFKLLKYHFFFSFLLFITKVWLLNSQESSLLYILKSELFSPASNRVTGQAV